MAYAAQADLEARASAADVLLVFDRDGDGAVDATALAAALADADAEIDSYLGARYSLPLAETPAILVRIACDVALYRGAHTVDALTEEILQRYEDAIELLEKIVEGKAALGLDDPQPEADGTVHYTSADWVITRSNLAGIF